MTVEDKYLLREPGYGDTADIGDINHNTDLIANGMYQNRLMIGKAYNPDREEPYMKGDLVVKQTTVLEDGSPVAYNFEYYKALEDNITGVWDTSKWELTDISTELATKGGADVTKTASGNPITFDDGADAPLVKCVTQITGSQDLHGQDKPWVGGAGKNKLENTASTTTVNGVTFTVNDDGSVLVNGTATNVAYFDINTFSALSQSYIVNGCPVGGSYNTSYSIWAVSENPYHEAVDSGSGVTINENFVRKIRIRIANGYTANNLLFKPMIRLSTVTDPTFEPYSNICPITAYTEGEIEVRGKNLLNKADMSATRNSTWLNDSCVLQSGTYTFSFNSSATSGGCTFNVFNANGDRIYQNPSTINLASKVTHTFTISEPSARVGSYINEASNISNIMIELGSTATTYEPYARTTHTATFSQSIYQGNADFVGSGARADWITADPTTDGTMSYNGTSSYSVHYTWRASNTKKSGKTNFISSAFGVIESGDEENKIVGRDNSDIIEFLLPLSVGNNLTAAKAYIASYDTIVAYELATPTTETITPTNLPIKSLFGYNHIESSTGDMEIEYITEEFQPLAELINRNSTVYSTSEHPVGIWVDGSTVYEKTLYHESLNVSRSDWTILDTLTADKFIDSSVTFTNNGRYLDKTYMRISYLNGNIYYHTPEINGTCDDVYIIVRYTKPTTPTRSLNLTKSAVTENDSKDEIPDEIKNAPFEEKPDVNEADDDAPTEVDER